ncbi:MAG: PAS domain S-box protein [Deltaproteobacteria bacterium]|nr:PAS domain S-box protein [Deltaproteobacteria bacterium]
MKDRISSAIIESMSDGLLVLNFHGYIIHTNPAALNLFDIDPQDLQNKTYIQLFMDRPENDAFNDIIFNGIQNRETRLYREVSYLKKGGARLDLAVTTSFLSDEKGEDHKAGIVLVAKDITEIRALDRARNRVLNHLSHELRTPLSIVKASMARLASDGMQTVIQRIARNLGRIEDIQMEVDDIVRKSNDAETLHFSQWVRQMLDILDMAAEQGGDDRKAMLALRNKIDDLFKISSSTKTPADPWKRIAEIVEAAKQQGKHRRVEISFVPGDPGRALIDSDLLDKCAMALIKNAVENTPDGGRVTVSVKNLEGTVELSIRDTGVGITEESQKQIFGGFYHAKDTDFYTTKKPFDFGAGGKGLDLLRLRVFSETFGFQLNCQSKRCIYIPSETDICPGDTTKCPHILEKKQCDLSGGSTFTILFPLQYKAQ